MPIAKLGTEFTLEEFARSPLAPGLGANGTLVTRGVNPFSNDPRKVFATIGLDGDLRTTTLVDAPFPSTTPHLIHGRPDG